MSMIKTVSNLKTDGLRATVMRWTRALTGTEAYSRAKTPTILQMEAVECGAACLAMILAYHGRHVPLEELRTQCGVSRDGSKASNIVKAAREYGMKADGYSKQPEDLREMEPPMILHWNFNHFVVFEGAKGDSFYINDPSAGPRVVPAEDFDRAFTGVVLTFEPSADFEEGGERRSLFESLQERLRGSAMGVLYVLLAGFALVIPGLIEPTFSQIFIDNVLIKRLPQWQTPLFLAMGATVLVYGALMWLRQSYLLRTEMKLALSMSSKFLWHVLRLPIRFFTQRSTGDINSRVALNDKVARLLSSDLATNGLNLIVIVFYAALMMQYDVTLTLVVVAVACINVAALKYVSKKRRNLSHRMLKESGKLMGAAMGGLKTIETLKATGSESDFFVRWAGHHAKVVSAQQKLDRYTQYLTAVPPFLMATSTALVLGFGGLRIVEGALSIGMLIAFQTLMHSFISPVNQMVGLGSKLQSTEGDMRRLDDIQQHAPAREFEHREVSGDSQAGSAPPVVAGSDEDESDRDNSGADDGGANDSAADVRKTSRPTNPAKLAGFLALDDVTFGYNPREEPLIEGFTLSLTPGSRVALVGGSGSGKSTIAKLVCGLLDPWEGAIRFDGQTRTTLSRRVMTHSFTFVDQQVTLFEDTVRNNLTLWDASVPDGDVVQAAKDACIHDEITSRPKGYDATIEEGGRNFSGGQRQRLEIARALVCNPSIMVLDEATSALDPATEERIDDNVRRRGSTCLIIAHRLSTIRDCEEIVVVDQGDVAQRGTHEELKDQPGTYSRLLETM